MDEQGTQLPGVAAIETIAVHAGRPTRSPDAPLNPPIVPASTFVAGGAMEYARDDAPTTAALEDVLGALDGGIATCFASGMAAANAVMDIVPMGGTVVALSDAYTGVAVRLRELHAVGRIDLRILDATDTDAIIAACTGASLLWLESPTNPMLEVVDLPLVLDAARDAGVMTLVDSTFATPILQRPLELGADLVLHSVTKSLAGHSDLLGGAVIARDPELAERIRSRRILLGGAPGAFDCYLAIRGVRTLAIRVERAQANAQAIVDRLRAHPAVTRVRYPGYGTIASIELADVAACDRFADAVRIWTHATSLGGVESLLERRRRWPKESPRVPESLMRLSFGIEDADDLWSDLDQALRS